MSEQFSASGSMAAIVEDVGREGVVDSGLDDSAARALLPVMSELICAPYQDLGPHYLPRLSGAPHNHGARGPQI